MPLLINGLTKNEKRNVMKKQFGLSFATSINREFTTDMKFLVAKTRESDNYSTLAVACWTMEPLGSNIVSSRVR